MPEPQNFDAVAHGTGVVLLCASYVSVGLLRVLWERCCCDAIPTLSFAVAVAMIKILFPLLLFAKVLVV